MNHLPWQPHDPRPLLSIAFVTFHDAVLPPRWLENPEGAHHRYKLLSQNEDGADLTDLTLLWVPVGSAPLSWIGVSGVRSYLRTDKKILIVLAEADGHTPGDLDALEHDVRERLSALGAHGDDLVVLRERFDGAPESGAVSQVVEAINRTTPQNTGYGYPFMAHAGLLVDGSEDTMTVSVTLGTLQEGDPVMVQPNFYTPTRYRFFQQLRNARREGRGTPVPMRVREVGAPGRTTLPGMPRLVELRRFEHGTVSFLGDDVPRPTILLPPGISRVSSVWAHITRLWSPGHDDEPFPLPEGGTLTAYLPRQGKGFPCTLTEIRPSTRDYSEFDATLEGLPDPPVFAGSWLLIHEPSRQLFRAE